MSQNGNGWVLLYRKFKQNFLWQEPRVFSRWEAFEDLFTEANHATAEIPFDGKVIEVKRGSLITSQLKLAQRWRWSRGKVERFLKLLSSRGMLSVQDLYRKASKITITNYNTYQIQRATDGQLIEQPTRHKQRMNKEGKRNSESIDSRPNRQKSFEEKRVSHVREFETWWAAEYQNRFGKPYLFSYGKEGRLVKTMLNVCDLDTLKRKATIFLDSKDEFTQQAGHTIGILFCRFNSLNGETKAKPVGLTETQKILMEMEA